MVPIASEAFGWYRTPLPDDDDDDEEGEVAAAAVVVEETSTVRVTVAVLDATTRMEFL